MLEERKQQKILRQTFEGKKGLSLVSNQLNSTKMKNEKKVTLSDETVQGLNQTLWSEMLSPTCTVHKPIIGIEKTLSDLSLSGVEIVLSNKESNPYSSADQRTLDRMTALLGEIINAQSLMLQESRMHGEEAEPELYEVFIENALEHLQHLGKIREKPVEFFCKKRNKLYFKCADYFLLDHILLAKTGLVDDCSSLEGTTVYHEK